MAQHRFLQSTCSICSREPDWQRQHGQAHLQPCSSPRGAGAAPVSYLKSGVEVGEGDRHERLVLAPSGGAEGVLGCAASSSPPACRHGCATCQQSAGEGCNIFVSKQQPS